MPLYHKPNNSIIGCVSFGFSYYNKHTKIKNVVKSQISIKSANKNNKKTKKTRDLKKYIKVLD